MQVFKTFFKISKRYKSSLIMYTAIFLTLLSIMASQNNKSTASDFTSTTLNIAIFDEDNSSLSTGLYDYLASMHDMTDISKDLDEIRDNMYKRNVDYVLIIPKGFEAEVINSNSTDLLEAYKLPSSIAAQFIDMQINKFISIYSTYLETGLDAAVAYEKTTNTLNTETVVNIMDKDEEDFSIVHFFYLYLPYILISIIISCLGPILVSFNKTEVKKRTLCSNISYLGRNLSIAAATIVYSLIIFAFFVIFSLIQYGNDMFTVVGGLRILNGFIYTLVSIGFAFILAQFTNNLNVLNMFSNIIGLGSSFLCGIFVGRELLAPAVVSIGRFFPAYWYVNVESALTTFDGTINSTIITGYLVQLLFAVALFAGGMVVNKLKK